MYIQIYNVIYICIYIHMCHLGDHAMKYDLMGACHRKVVMGPLNCLLLSHALGHFSILQLPIVGKF